MFKRYAGKRPEEYTIKSTGENKTAWRDVGMTLTRDEDNGRMWLSDHRTGQTIQFYPIEQQDAGQQKQAYSTRDAGRKPTSESESRAAINMQKPFDDQVESDLPF